MGKGVILDQFGNPIRRKKLSQEIAAPSVTGIRQAWHESIISTVTPHRLPLILQAADQGDIRDFLTLAEEMEERDPHYSPCMGIRKRAVSGLDPVVEAASTESHDEKLADAVREMVAGLDMAGLVEGLLDGLGKGFSVTEIIWNKTAYQWTPEKLVWRDPRFFTFDQDTLSKVLMLDEENINGVPLEPYKFIVHKPRLKSGIPIRGGLARPAAASFLCKSMGLKGWMAFAEVFGLPMRLGRYGPNATQADVQTLVAAVTGMGADAAAVLPDSMRIEFQEAVKGDGDLFEKLVSWLDRQTSKAVLGQTMTTDDGASHSQASVHNDVRQDIVKADGSQVSATLNRDFVRPFIDLNHGPQERYPRITFPVPEPEDIKALSEALAKLVPLGGMKVSAREVRGKLGLGDPGEGEEILGQPIEPPTPATALNRQQPTQQPVSDEVDLLVSELLDNWEPQVEPLVNPILSAANSSSTFEEFQEKLNNLAGAANSQPLVDSLTTGAVTAKALGDQGNG